MGKTTNLTRADSKLMKAQPKTASQTKTTQNAGKKSATAAEATKITKQAENIPKSSYAKIPKAQSFRPAIGARKKGGNADTSTSKIIAKHSEMKTDESMLGNCGTSANILSKVVLTTQNMTPQGRKTNPEPYHTPSAGVLAVTGADSVERDEACKDRMSTKLGVSGEVGTLNKGYESSQPTPSKPTEMTSVQRTDANESNMVGPTATDFIGISNKQESSIGGKDGSFVGDISGKLLMTTGSNVVDMTRIASEADALLKTSPNDEIRCTCTPHQPGRNLIDVVNDATRMESQNTPPDKLMTTIEEPLHTNRMRSPVKE
jgi:hypothetical protein